MTHALYLKMYDETKADFVWGATQIYISVNDEGIVINDLQK